MKTFIVISFLLLVLGLSVLWHKARSKLAKEKKRNDIDRTTKQDIFALCLLLLGYILIYLFPVVMTLIIYLAASLLIGLLIEFRYYRWLIREQFPKKFVRQSILFSSLMFYATAWLGILLLL